MAAAADSAMLTVEALEKDNPRRGKATQTPTWYALRQLFFFRTLSQLRDPMYLSARIVDKFIFGGIIMSLFHGIADNPGTDNNATQISGVCVDPAPPARDTHTSYTHARIPCLTSSTHDWLPSACFVPLSQPHCSCKSRSQRLSRLATCP